MRARTARPVGAGLADGAPAVRSSRACGGPGTSWSLGGNGASVRTRRGPRLSPPVRTGRGVTRPGPRGLRGIRNAIDFTAKSLLQDPAPSPHGRVRRKGTESTLGTGGRVARFGRSHRSAQRRWLRPGRFLRPPRRESTSGSSGFAVGSKLAVARIVGYPCMDRTRTGAAFLRESEALELGGRDQRPQFPPPEPPTSFPLLCSASETPCFPGSNPTSGSACTHSKPGRAQPGGRTKCAPGIGPANRPQLG